MIKYRSKETRNKGPLPNILTNAVQTSKKKKRQIARKSDNYGDGGCGGGGGEGGDDVTVRMYPLIFFFVNITLNYEKQVKWQYAEAQ
jgi:hypothetical protein